MSRRGFALHTCIIIIFVFLISESPETKTQEPTKCNPSTKQEATQ